MYNLAHAFRDYNVAFILILIFNVLLFRTAWASQVSLEWQTILNFSEVKADEVAVAWAGLYACWMGMDAFVIHPTTSVKH